MPFRSLADLPEDLAPDQLVKLRFDFGETVFLARQEDFWRLHPEFIPVSLGYLISQLIDRTVRTEGRVIVKEPVIFCFDGIAGSVASSTPLRSIALCHYSSAYRGTLTLY